MNDKTNYENRKRRFRKIRVFIHKHTTLLTVLPAVAVWGILTALTFGNKLAPAYNGAAAMVTMFISSFALKTYQSKFWKEAQRELYQNCDPFPSLSELSLYVECAGRRTRIEGLKMTLSTALSLAGKYKDAEEMLSSLDNGTSEQLPDEARAVIYYNFAALYCAMNMPENAKEKYDRSKELFMTSRKSFSDKMLFNGTTDAEIECYKGNGERALAILSMIEPDNRFQEVLKKFTLAKVHYILGNREEALSEFDWVAKTEIASPVPARRRK